MKKKKFYLYKKGVVLCLITIIQRKCDKIVMKKQENDEQMEKKFAIVKNGAKMEEKAKDTMGGGRMQYEGQICRAPMERGSYMLPVAVGCSYNACKFCTLFKHLQYRELPIAQIEEELQRVKGLNGRPRRVFLGDGNAFGMKTERLLKILETGSRVFSGCRGGEYGCYRDEYSGEERCRIEEAMGSWSAAFVSWNRERTSGCAGMDA